MFMKLVWGFFHYVNVSDILQNIYIWFMFLFFFFFFLHEVEKADIFFWYLNVIDECNNLKVGIFFSVLNFWYIYFELIFILALYLEDMVNTKCIAIFDAKNFPLKLILFANTISCDFEHNQITWNKYLWE
jgi:hypothetical protein